MTLTSGFADERFAAVRDVLEANLASGEDIGAAVAMTVDGETVVDLWGGYADAAKTRPWESDTIVNVYSVSKTMTALTALVLADRGDLDLHGRVADYWPEFAAGGKQDITVAQLMSHSSGLSGWKEPIPANGLFDWDLATSMLAAQEPFWEPGTVSGYHGMTQGYLVGEVVRRITGKSLGTIYREEIAEPLKADFHIGFGPEHDHRVADIVLGGMATPEPDAPPMTPLMINMITNPMSDLAGVNTREWRVAEIPAANGHGNARSVAQVHAALANGGVAGGVKLLSEAGCRKALELQVEGTDLVLNFPIRFGIGFGLTGEQLHAPNASTIFWPGAGGSLSIIDLDARTTFAYTPNRLWFGNLIGDRGQALASAFWESLGR